MSGKVLPRSKLGHLKRVRGPTDVTILVVSSPFFVRGKTERENFKGHEGGGESPFSSKFEKFYLPRVGARRRGRRVNLGRGQTVRAGRRQVPERLVRRAVGQRRSPGARRGDGLGGRRAPLDAAVHHAVLVRRVHWVIARRVPCCAIKRVVRYWLVTWPIDNSRGFSMANEETTAALRNARFIIDATGQRGAAAMSRRCRETNGPCITSRAANFALAQSGSGGSSRRRKTRFVIARGELSEGWGVDKGFKGALRWSRSFKGSGPGFFFALPSIAIRRRACGRAQKSSLRVTMTNGPPWSLWWLGSSFTHLPFQWRLKYVKLARSQVSDETGDSCSNRAHFALLFLARLSANAQTGPSWYLRCIGSGKKSPDCIDRLQVDR